MSVFDSFERKHDFLICVDSDGCAMDTMNCKHFHCFGPCMVMEWELDQWRASILERWNDVNLFQMTRGINRFKGLALALAEVDRKYTPIPGIATLERWVAEAKALSNGALAEAILAEPEGDGRRCLEKALVWSDAVNAGIVQLPDALKVPFYGALEGLAAAHGFADVAVVSSANRAAVEEEWAQHGLLEHTDILLTQDRGSKAYCIGRMLEYGYAPEKVLMVGDAPGDLEAARKNGVWFYPILVNQEAQSWAELRQIGFDKLLSGTYGGYQPMKERQFLENLGG